MKNSYKEGQTMNSKRGIIRSLVCTTWLVALLHVH